MKQVSYYVFGNVRVTHKNIPVTGPMIYALVIQIPEINMPSEEDHAKIPQMLRDEYKKYVLSKLKNERWLHVNLPTYVGLKKSVAQMLEDNEFNIMHVGEGLRHALIADFVKVPANYPDRHQERPNPELMFDSEKQYWNECFWLWDQLDGGEIDTLIALVENGPLWPGDLPSKASYTDLESKGLATCKVLGQDPERTRYATLKGVDVYVAHFGGVNREEAMANRRAKRAIQEIQKSVKNGDKP